MFNFNSSANTEKPLISNKTDFPYKTFIYLVNEYANSCFAWKKE